MGLPSSPSTHASPPSPQAAVDFKFPLETREILLIAAVLIGAGLALSLLLLAWVAWRVRRIRLPDGADFFTALRATPLAVVILLDLLDFSLDLFAAPFAWTILGYLGLTPLRGVTLVESLIPGTQFIPTMTLAWLLARLARSGQH